VEQEIDQGRHRRRPDLARRVVALTVAGALFAGCGADRDPQASSRAVTGSTVPAETQGARSRALVPQDVIEIDGVTGAMALAAGDGYVWTSGDQAAWRIDPETDEAIRVPVPIAHDGWTGMVIADGDLWALDVHGNRILRVDPTIAATRATIDVANPTSPALAGGGLWIAHERVGGLSRVDLATERVDLEIADGRGVTAAGDSVWYTSDGDRPDSVLAIEADGRTGATIGEVSIPATTGCGFLAAADERVWSMCSDGLANPPVTHVATIDPDREDTTRFELDRWLAGGLIEVGGRVWGLAAARGVAPAALIELGPRGPTGRSVELPAGFAPNDPVVAAGSLWIPWDGTGRLFRFSLRALQ